MVDARPICETCGHTREWHDPDTQRVRRGSDPPSERPCYREVGGDACGCSGFRDSGTFATRPGIAVMRTPAPDLATVRFGIIALLVVVMLLGLLYAYRSQTPSMPQVDVNQALQHITAGRIQTVVVAENNATLEFRDNPAHREQTTIPEPDTVLAPAISKYNAANPSQIILKYTDDGQGIGVIGPIILNLLPVLLIGGTLSYLVIRARRRS